MKLIVGLGNPGTKYEKTRHNVGFMVVEQFLKDVEPVEDTVWENNIKLKSDIAKIDWQPKQRDLETVILAKPKTFMNNSGMAVRLIADFYKINPADMWVVYDDIDLPVGGMRIRLGGGDGGHRGIQSIREQLGIDTFWRFRMGIGHPRTIQNAKLKIQNYNHVDDYVVGTFQHAELSKIRQLIKKGSNALTSGLEHGLEATMNTFNTK